MSAACRARNEIKDSLSLGREKAGFSFSAPAPLSVTQISYICSRGDRKEKYKLFSHSTSTRLAQGMTGTTCRAPVADLQHLSPWVTAWYCRQCSCSDHKCVIITSLYYSSKFAVNILKQKGLNIQKTQAWTHSYPSSFSSARFLHLCESVNKIPDWFCSLRYGLAHKANTILLTILQTV